MYLRNKSACCVCQNLQGEDRPWPASWEVDGVNGRLPNLNSDHPLPASTPACHYKDRPPCSQDNPHHTSPAYLDMSSRFPLNISIWILLLAGLLLHYSLATYNKLTTPQYTSQTMPKCAGCPKSFDIGAPMANHLRHCRGQNSHLEEKRVRRRDDLLAKRTGLSGNTIGQVSEMFVLHLQLLK